VAGLEAQGGQCFSPVLGGAADDFGDITDDLGHKEASFVYLCIQFIMKNGKSKGILTAGHGTYFSSSGEN
jgi:hypothetical protein